MKKVLISVLCLSLSGCSIYSAKFIEGPSPGANWPKQSDAPLPWICIIPSENTTSMSGINFFDVTRAIRFSMSFAPYQKTYENVRLVLIDFRKLPASAASNKNMILAQDCEKYSKNYINLPERYQLTMSFFIGTTRPPCEPYYKETLTMPTSKAPPHEAIMMMSNEIIEDLNVSDERKLDVAIR